MKLLFDANISWRVRKQLENDFPNCLHSSAIPVIQPAKDIDIWYFAKQNQFTIVTHDDDFEKLIQTKGAPPKVIIIKAFNQNTKQIAQTLIAQKNVIESFVTNNELMILEIY